MIAPMKKVTLIGLDAQKKNITDDILKVGCLHVEDILSDEVKDLLQAEGSFFWTEKFETQINHTAEALAFLKQLDHTKKPLFAQKRNVSLRDFETAVSQLEDILQKIYRVLRLKKSFQNVEQLKNKLETDLQALMPWESYDVAMDVVKTDHARILLGTFPAGFAPAEMEAELHSALPLCAFQVISADKMQTYAAFIVHKHSYPVLEDILKVYSWAPVLLEAYHGTVPQYMALLRKNIADLEQQLLELREIAQAFMEDMQVFETIYDYLNYRHRSMQVAEGAAGTQSAFVLSGYIPAKQQETVAKVLEKYTVSLQIEDVPEGEEFPVKIENRAVVRPFEVITDLFSVPSSLSIDSNAVMAVFYFIFFGMMISDAGYGIVLSLITGIILFRYKLSGMMKKMFQLIFLGGISTLIWGALFGGWFGDLAELTGGAVSVRPLWFNPLDDPMRLLTVSLLLGGIHLLTGMALNAYKMIKRGEIWDAVFDVGLWYLVLIGLPLLFLGGTIATVGTYMAIAGGIGLILTQGRHEKKLLKKLISGVLSLYDVTGYLSDVLSYSRLLALGLATGVVGTVINTMVTMAGNSVWGYIILIVGFLVGHIFNMAINTLGAFVHASRLQYVEFFGKFFESGGQLYAPLTIQSKYIQVETN